jgi:hypothetical protein
MGTSRARETAGLLAISVYTAAVGAYAWAGWASPHLMIEFAPDVVVTTGAVVLSVLVGLEVLALVVLWRSRFRAAHPGVSGYALLIGILTAIIQSGATGSLVFHLPTILEASAIANALPGYALIEFPERKSLLLRGTVGRGVAAKIWKSYQRQGGVGLLEIDSNGGLVGEALWLAQFVEEKRIAVVARGNCDSACVVVALAGRPSFADESLDFGFHRASIDLPSRGILTLATKLEQAELTKYLRAHGVPNDIVTAASRTSGDQMVYTAARRLVDVGAIDGLVNGWSVTYGRYKGTTVSRP